MTILDTPTLVDTSDFQIFPIDLYRDIHKGIRAELFAITSAAGSVDPSDDCGRAALADHVASVAWLLESHREHEDGFVLPVLVEHLPSLAERIEVDHPQLEEAFGSIVELSTVLVAERDVAERRRLAQLLYLQLSGYTSTYLAHQLVEECVIMPALERVVGPGAVLEMHTGIVTSIPPEDMARSLALMLPAMNLDDRTELLGGMQAAAPAEAFAGVVSLARSVLAPADFNAVAGRLGL